MKKNIKKKYWIAKGYLILLSPYRLTVNGQYKPLFTTKIGPFFLHL